MHKTVFIPERWFIGSAQYADFGYIRKLAAIFRDEIANGQKDKIKDDTLHGRQTHYSPDGGYKARSSYDMGIKVDSFLLYNSNGLVNLEEYRDSTGTRQGQFRVYDTNGQLIQLGRYEDGKFDGEFRTFYRTGKLKTIEHYRQGERIGTWIGLSTTGDTIKLEQY